MKQVAGTNTYTIPDEVKRRPYGLTGIGCLIMDGAPVPFDQQDWHVPKDRRDAWTIVAWGETKYRAGMITRKSNDFFLIVCHRGGEAGEKGYAIGWTWDDAVNFLTKGLPSYVSQNYGRTLTIIGAMMLDGGSSTQFIYRCEPEEGRRAWEKTYGARKVPTMVRVFYSPLKRCSHPGHSH